MASKDAPRRSADRLDEIAIEACKEIRGAQGRFFVHNAACPVCRLLRAFGESVAREAAEVVSQTENENRQLIADAIRERFGLESEERNG